MAYAVIRQREAGQECRMWAEWADEFLVAHVRATCQEVVR